MRLVPSLAVMAAGCGASSGQPGGAATPEPAAPGPSMCCPVVELRQYTLHPGGRDVLIEIFDREFVETQEATGMRILGQFRDLGDADRFVWLRGFRDMASRTTALESFYGGPVWKAHGKAAAATMIDSDNVLLLRPARPNGGFSLGGRERPAPGASEIPTRIAAITVCSFDSPVTDAFVDFFEQGVVPALVEAGARVEAGFVTESSPNGYPRLPVREGEHVFVWMSSFSDRPAYDRHISALRESARWRDVSRSLHERLKGPPQTLLLSPTSRSLL